VKRAAVASAAALALALFGATQIAHATWIHARAFVAQELIAFAWKRAQASGAAPRPWPGADWRPVARISVPAHGVAVFVLDDAHARALSYGPAHLAGTAAPGAMGNSVVVAHRDTHFAFLRHVAIDDEIDVESARGERLRYRVTGRLVVDKHDMAIAQPTAGSRLTLVTCYPFDALRPGTPLRYVIVAERMT